MEVVIWIKQNYLNKYEFIGIITIYLNKKYVVNVLEYVRFIWIYMSTIFE